MYWLLVVQMSHFVQLVVSGDRGEGVRAMKSRAVPPTSVGTVEKTVP